MSHSHSGRNYSELVVWESETFLSISFKDKAHRIVHCIFTPYSCIKIQAIIQSIYMKRMNQKTKNAEIQILAFLDHGKGMSRHNWQRTCDKSISNTADCEKPGKECKLSLYQLSGSNS
jgi:hypothetical protein